MEAPKTFLHKGGGYENLAVYKKATVIYDLTFYFTQRFLTRGDRTIDQMVQAARSGKQNITEGSAASSTSSETELKLMNVARASMQELLVDYEDYLRVRNLQIWPLKDERAVKTREFCKHHVEAADFMADIDRRSDEAIANITLTLIHQFDSMMGRLLDRLQKDFVEKGGIREQMTAARLGYRNEQKARIAELEAENTALKARVAELEGLLAQKGGGQ
jgi:four helix bundle suffix protein